MAISRRRRRSHEKAEADKVHTAANTDRNGNEQRPSPPAGKRLATPKEVKRIKKAAAARRRSGEECLTEDEADAANLMLPELKSKVKADNVRGQVAPTEEAPPAGEIREWMSLIGTEPSPYSSMDSLDSSGSGVVVDATDLLYLPPYDAKQSPTRAPSGTWC